VAKRLILITGAGNPIANNQNTITARSRGRFCCRIIISSSKNSCLRKRTEHAEGWGAHDTGMSTIGESRLGKSNT
jgi:hypothetical protein